MITHIKKKFNLGYALSLFNIKVVAGKKTYFPSVFPLVGFLNFLRTRKLSKTTLLLLAIPLYSIILGLINFDKTSIARSIQLLGLVLTIDFFKEFANKKFVEGVAVSAIVLSIVMMLVEYLTGDLLPTHYMMSVKRFKMLLGEPNFSAYFYVVILALLTDMKSSWRLKLPLILMIVLTMSRMGILAVILLQLFSFIKYKKVITKLSFLFIFSYPLMIFSLDRNISMEQRKVVSKVFSRFYIQTTYIDTFRDSVFGDGYFRSRKVNNKYVVEENEYLKEKFGVKDLETNEHHNVAIQILRDFGILVYIYIMSLIIYFNIPKRVLKFSTTVFIILVCSTFLNSLNEIGIFLTIGLIVKEHGEKKDESIFSS